ncbi:MAG TPA: hypothetical protein VF384_17975 [Planctomycetota bacterium]
MPKPPSPSSAAAAARARWPRCSWRKRLLEGSYTIDVTTGGGFRGRTSVVLTPGGAEAVNRARALTMRLHVRSRSRRRGCGRLPMSRASFRPASALYSRPRMQIPEHWAEARVVGRVKGRDRVVRRFGWSDTSPADAQRLAEQRATQALVELQAGRPVAPREKKLAYGGAGLPIREQVLARHGDLVITRNSYGAHCLNEPDVMFADIDFATHLPFVLRLIAGLMGPLGVASLGIMLAANAWLIGGLGLAVAIAVGTFFAMLGKSRTRRERQHREQTENVRRVIAAEPRGRAAIYETPRGLRVLVLHKTFEPDAESTQQFLRALGSDRAYVLMCALQSCFRARVSGKPWRMGVRHIRPRPGVWPVHPDRSALRDAWVTEYEAVAVKYAACRFLEDVGDGPVHPRCAEVQRVHDALSRARSDLPLA